MSDRSLSKKFTAPAWKTNLTTTKKTYTKTLNIYKKLTIIQQKAPDKCKTSSVTSINT